MEAEDDTATRITLCPNGVGQASLSLQLGGACVRRSKLLTDMLTDCTTTTDLTTPFPPSHIVSWMLFSAEHGSRETSFTPDSLCRVLQVLPMC